MILLAHEPTIFRRVPERVSLTLCGHTHGGQVNLPIFTNRMMRSHFGFDLIYGHHGKRPASDYFRRPWHLQRARAFHAAAGSRSSNHRRWHGALPLRFCKFLAPNRTKTFHVKRFGPIGGPDRTNIHAWHHGGMSLSGALGGCPNKNPNKRKRPPGRIGGRFWLVRGLKCGQSPTSASKF